MAYKRTIETDKFKLQITQWFSNPNDWRFDFESINPKESAYIVADAAYAQAFFDALQKSGKLPDHRSGYTVKVLNFGHGCLIEFGRSGDWGKIELTAEQIAELLP